MFCGLFGVGTVYYFTQDKSKEGSLLSKDRAVVYIIRTLSCGRAHG